MKPKGMSSEQGSSVKRRGLFRFVAVIVLLLLFVLPFSYRWVSNYQELGKASAKLNAVLEEERRMNFENDQLRRYSSGENFDEYLERYARDEMGYADPNERVYHVRPEKKTEN